MSDDDALRAMLRDCTLVDVVCRDMSARLRIQGEGAPEGVEEGAAATDLTMGFDLVPEKIDFAFTVRVASIDMEAGAEVVARYEYSTPADQFDEATVVAFANRVAFMAAYPFLREVIRTLTARLPIPSAVVLPVIQDPPGFTRSEG